MPWDDPPVEVCERSAEHQVHELVLQLRGQAGERQVPNHPRVAYAQLYGPRHGRGLDPHDLSHVGRVVLVVPRWGPGCPLPPPGHRADEPHHGEGRENGERMAQDEDEDRDR